MKRNSNGRGVITRSATVQGRRDKEGRHRNINLLCSKCVRSCKQSSKVTVCACPKFTPAGAQEEGAKS